jgi:DNA-binding LytR/AlgR family response regulator
MKPINCIIIDDEEIDRLLIKDYVETSRNLKLFGTYSNAVESLNAMRTENIDLLFLDIDMPIINGIDFLKKFERHPLCIFITSHPEFALDAFELHAVDYLLKPVKKGRFDVAVERADELISIRKKALDYDLNFEKETLTIKEGTSINKVKVNDIIYLEALTNYTKVVTVARKFITLKNLKSFLEELPPDKFLRIHRSYAVAKNKISSLQYDEVVIEGHELPLGKTYRKQIKRFLSENEN